MHGHTNFNLMFVKIFTDNNFQNIKSVKMVWLINYGMPPINR